MSAVVVEDPTIYEYAAGSYGILLKFTLQDEDGDPIDLTGTTVTMRMQDQNAAADEASVLDATCQLSGYGVHPTQGECYYLTQNGDAGFDTEGKYWIQLSVSDGGATYRYRNPKFAIVHVTRSLLAGS